MEFEWDEAKNEHNIAERNLPFALAARVFLDHERMTKPAKRQDYGESRYLTYGKVDGRLLVVVHTPREGRTRVVSVRKANSREQRKFAQWQQEQSDG